MSERLLEVANLGIAFETEHGPVDVVQRRQPARRPGETLVILGESGSGKSVTASAIMDLLDRPPASITSGRILFRGRGPPEDVAAGDPGDERQEDQR